jgi:hypothetical protein
MGIAAGAEANRVAVEAMIKARNEGRDFYKEGPDILKKVASRNRALDVALAAWGDITFKLRIDGPPGRRPNAHPRLSHTEEQSMRITQGTFSYLPDFTDEEITAQISYALENGWPLSVEFTDDPHPRNTY